MNLPKDLFYSKEHEWVKKEGENTYQIGITDFAQSELGDIVYVDIPEVGTEIKKGEAVGAVESSKTVSDLYAPVSGKVAEVNQELDDSPELLNEDPYSAWILKLENVSEKEMQELLSAEEYAKEIE